MDLLPLARKYIWWQSPEHTLRDRHRLIAQVMNIGTLADVEALRAAGSGYASNGAGIAGEETGVSRFPRLEPNTLTVLTAGRDTDRVKISFFGGRKFGEKVVCLGHGAWTRVQGTKNKA